MSHKKNLDSIHRYQKRQKWYPNREHRGGVGGGDVDCMGDESLYKPSRLGYAEVSPTTVEVGARSALVLTYVAGENSIPEGASVYFVNKGQASLGMHFQVDDPDKPGYMAIEGPRHCRFELFQWDRIAGATFPIGFTLKEGELARGDVVTLRSLPQQGFEWTKLSGRKEIRVVINYNDGSAEQRLPEPLTIDILPGCVKRLAITVPAVIGSSMQAATGKASSGPSNSRRHKPAPHSPDLPLHITARDRFDNRVPIEESITLDDGVKTREICMTNGLYRGIWEGEDAPVIRVRGKSRATGLIGESNPGVKNHEYGLYFGDMHIHDLLSEAQGYPDEVYAWGRDERNFDFLAVSVQSHGWIDNETWTLAKYMAERFHEEGSFITFLSQEWQHSAFGDKVIHYLGGDQPYLDVEDKRYNSLDKVYAALRQSDAFIIGHHPAYPLDTWVPGTNLELADPALEPLVEIWSMHGSSEGYDEQDRPLIEYDPQNYVYHALREGARVGFTAGSDTHTGRPGGSWGEPRPYYGGFVGVWAPELTRRSLFDAFRARRTYALTGARIICAMKVNNAWMGSELPFSKNVAVKIDVWAETAIERIELMKQARVHKTYNPGGEEAHLEFEEEIRSPAFYHCRVVQEDGHLAVCSPVWIG